MVYDFERFRQAQASKYNGWEKALEELKNGEVLSRWIWFVFPQLRGTGRDYNADFYGLEGMRETKAYLGDEVLGDRLRKASQALLAHEGRQAGDILGAAGAEAVQACMTLFDRVCPGDVFARVLDVFYAGKRHAATVKRLDR